MVLGVANAHFQLALSVLRYPCANARRLNGCGGPAQDCGGRRRKALRMALLRTRVRRRDRAVGDQPPSRVRRVAAPSDGDGPRPPIVELRDATVVYPGGHVGVERVSFALERGEFAFVVGPTGCGKSTLIKMLIREVEPASGEVRIAGRDINRLPAGRLPHLRRRIGTVFQDFKLLPNRSVFDNVAYTLQVTGGSRADIRRKVPEILRLVGLQGKVHSYPDQLSGGEQQRVSIARAFVNHPPLLLADEPTGNLDPETSIGIMQLLYRINRTGTTVLVATHDREMVDRMRRRVMALDEGRLVRDEATAGYAEESTGEFALRMRAEMGVGAGHGDGFVGRDRGGPSLLLHRRGVPSAAPQRGPQPGRDRDRRADDAAARCVHPSDQGQLDHQRERALAARPEGVPLV